MRVCFTSYRPFADGPVSQPFLESDPANIAYALGGVYLSFYTLRKLSDRELRERLQPYDFILVALDVEALELVRRIVATCPGRVATYSEGHIADYQRLSPAGQVSFVQIINQAQANFLYWEKYLPFYRALTNAPVEYLPYPYLLNEAHQFALPVEQRASLAALPTGFAGFTRNGLVNLTVAKKLLEAKWIEELACWLETATFEQDTEAISYFLFSETDLLHFLTPTFNWRRWLSATQIDYRILLKVKAKFFPTRLQSQPRGALKIKNVFLYRRESWPKYLRQLSSARLLIDLNNRETVGRNALDCAALGIPCLSTNRSDLQPKIFPETTLLDPWDITTACQLCERLLSDKVFYQRVIDQAQTQAAQFDITSFQNKFHMLATKLHLLE